jgi:hypothetical protein
MTTEGQERPVEFAEMQATGACNPPRVPGTPFSRDHLLGIFDRALEGGDVDYALRTARNIHPPVDLDRALRLTVGMARGHHPSYALAARRFVSRFAEEEPGATLRNLAQVTDALAVLHVVSEASTQEREEAERGMLRLATQLEEHRTALAT